MARLEALLARKAFNQLGGLQLDRDIRALVSCPCSTFCSSLTSAR